MKLVVVGSGYVGLVSGTCFAELGNEVVCLDADTAKVASLRAGRIPIYEPGLEEMVKANVAARRLSFTDRMASAAPGADAFFIAVGTPPRIGDGEADLAHVRAAAAEIGRLAPAGAIVVTKSTVPVGTGDAVEFIIRSERGRDDVAVVSNPEFLREGSAIGDFMNPDRVIVGTDVPRARERLGSLYAPLAEKGVPLLFTSRRAAEVIKYASNAFLAAKISFINEMADFCEATGASISEVSQGVGLDRRIGASFLSAGPGYGGSCFPKDSTALLATAHRHSVNLRLVESTIAVNDARKRAIGRRVLNAMGGSGYGKEVAVLGLAFKPDTDDMRESPAISIISTLQAAGATVRAYDPEAMRNARSYLRDVVYAENAYDCIAGCDCAVLVTEWAEFHDLDFLRLGVSMRDPVFVDLRNAIDRKALQAAGFVTYGIGDAGQPQQTHAPAATKLRFASPKGGVQKTLDQIVNGGEVVSGIVREAAAQASKGN